MSLDEVVLDFRSDTFTKPTAAMREALATAEVGDDVFEEDPTVKRLEEKTAGLFGREAALFVPSGTMANLIGLALHCERGHEVIMERRTHSFAHEVGGGAALLGVVFNTLDSPDGILTIEQVQAAIRSENVHHPVSRLVILENTINLAGGRVVPMDRIRQFREMTLKRNMRLHMDGARIWNASIASGVSFHDYASTVDTLSCCLSKGLGCPVGSLVIGDKSQMDKARWLRKMLGGGMRQAGILAACGLYALDNHIYRLKDDHQQAQDLAAGLKNILDDRYQVQPPETNILLIRTDSEETTTSTLSAWAKINVLALPLNPTTIRLVTHLDIPP
ncbi:low-specificity L-threonine aldolase, partial [Myxococcota bacterium]